jgi:hypothetical protein
MVLVARTTEVQELWIYFAAVGGANSELDFWGSGLLLRLGLSLVLGVIYISLFHLALRLLCGWISLSITAVTCSKGGCSDFVSWTWWVSVKKR